MKILHVFFVVVILSASSNSIDTNGPNAIYQLNRRPRNCGDIQINGFTKSGTYKIFPDATKQDGEGINVFCDLDQEEGWAVLMRQVEMNASEQVEFNRTWNEYARGFGDFEESFWLGLDVISVLTQAGNVQLRVDLEDWEGNATYAIYNTFQVGNISELYKLNVSDYSGTAGDALDYHNGMRFTTFDRDNDEHIFENCAMLFTGGWWYRNCYKSHLTGTYNKTRGSQGIIWDTFHGTNYSLKSAEMKIRDRDFECINKAIKSYFN